VSDRRDKGISQGEKDPKQRQHMKMNAERTGEKNVEKEKILC
jgi:hypothetical protein